ncbi:MAG: hypothetical protein HDQ99_03855 [Lachnospiraceae bacterium]|nr:hypothetical protein [Lachnospiraceae bacterium]
MGSSHTKKLVEKGVEMEKEELYQEIREVLCSVFKKNVENIDFDQLGIDDDLFQILQMNSLLSIEVLVWLENTLDIEFNDEDLTSEQVRTIRGIAELCMSTINLKERRGSYEI